jgi:aspartyl protease family protein
VGEAPVAVGGGAGSSGAGKIVLAAGSGGHFMSSGSINGQAGQFMVDTGASVVALSEADAQRMGIDYRQGAPVTVRTAGGDIRAHRVMLARVRVGEVELTNIEAVVQPTPLPFVLLGNSFLSRFQMRRENDLMTLERRF